MGIPSLRFAAPLVRSVGSLQALNARPLKPFLSPDLMLGQSATYGSFRANPAGHFGAISTALGKTPLAHIHPWNQAQTRVGHIEASRHFAKAPPSDLAGLKLHISTGLEMIAETTTTQPARLGRISQHLESLVNAITREQRIAPVVATRAARVANAE